MANKELGELELELDGEVITLTPSLDACMTISRMYGGVTNVIPRLTSFDFDTIVGIIAAGTGRNVSKVLQEKVYKTGVVNVVSTLIDFVAIVNNGGKPTDRMKKEGKEEGNPPA
jgi:hypothetical protein